MRWLASVIHLVVTIWAALIAPQLLLLALQGYFRAYPDSVATATYGAFALGTSFLGGSILGRTFAWRARTRLLTALLWLLVIGATTARCKADGVEVALENAAVLLSQSIDLFLLALGMSIGLQIGARFMKPFDSKADPARS